MSVEDLPLFAWRPSAEIVPFPGGKMIGDARFVAAKLNRTSAEDTRQEFWNFVTAWLRERLGSIDVETETIESEIMDFHDLVRQEQTRMALTGCDHSRRPGGAS